MKSRSLPIPLPSSPSTSLAPPSSLPILVPTTSSFFPYRFVSVRFFPLHTLNCWYSPTLFPHLRSILPNLLLLTPLFWFSSILFYESHDLWTFSPNTSSFVPLLLDPASLFPLPLTLYSPPFSLLSTAFPPLPRIFPFRLLSSAFFPLYYLVLLHISLRFAPPSSTHRFLRPFVKPHVVAVVAPPPKHSFLNPSRILSKFDFKRTSSISNFKAFSTSCAIRALITFR